MHRKGQTFECKTALWQILLQTPKYTYLQVILSQRHSSNFIVFRINVCPLVVIIISWLFFFFFGHGLNIIAVLFHMFVLVSEDPKKKCFNVNSREMPL